MNKELQVIAELLNTANKNGAYDLNQVGAGINALNNLTKTLVEHGIVSQENGEERVGPGPEKSTEKA